MFIHKRNLRFPVPALCRLPLTFPVSYGVGHPVEINKQTFDTQLVNNLKMITTAGSIISVTIPGDCWY
jgi:hypothetical protein